MELDQRAYGLLEVRSLDEAKRTFIGIANSDSWDSHGTLIEPDGAVFTLPIPLSYHERGEHAYIPFGNVIRTWVEKGKRWVESHVPQIPDDGTAGGRSVRDRVDAHWAEVKNGLVRGLSIDFQPIDPPHARKGTRVKKWAFRGLTIVPIPSNMDASIMSVRSILAASGDPTQSEVPASRATQTTNPRHGKMTTQETITQYENTRAAKVAQRDALLEKSAEEGETLNESDAETFDTLDTEIRSVDAHLVRLATKLKDEQKRAAPVNGTSIAKAAESRSGVPVVTVKSNAEPGISFARYAMSLAQARGNRYEAAQLAKRQWGEGAEEIVAELEGRAAVAAGTTTNATFAAPLVQTNFLNEFLELLRPLTLVGRVPGLRKVPFNTSMPAQTAGGTYSWVGQGAGKPVTNAQYAAVTLGFAKASGIIVLTEELVRMSTPSAQEAVRDEMLKGITQFLDDQFIDPAVAAVANVNPASITNGVAGTAASGTTAAAARADIRARIAAFAAANFGLAGLVITMSESDAFILGTMVNASDEVAFPGLGVSGGNILGIPVVTSETVGDQIVFIHAPSVLLADEGGVEIDVSREASLIMDSAPDSVVQAAAAPPIHTSLWQKNLVGLRAERFISWGKARATAVDRITAVAYA